MNLQRLKLSYFKNIETADLMFSPCINAFCGDNGSGKTNLLDAVYYLSMCKSCINQSDKDNITFAHEQAVLLGQYLFAGEKQEQIACRIGTNGEKVFKRNGKTYSRISQHVGLIPLVMAAPLDISLIQESGLQRRRYMNFLLAQAQPSYLQAIQQYRQLLFQRNKCLKQSDYDGNLMQALDFSLCRKAAQIHAARSELCDLLCPLINRYYSLLSCDDEQVGLQYLSDLNGDTMDNLLLQYASRDRQFQFTSTGVQRDDILFTLNGHKLKFAGSQGQQKSFLLALKLAQFSLLRQWKQTAPLLLLDDVFDKLDRHRVSNLLHIVVSENFGQIFITDSNKARIKDLIDALSRDYAFFKVEKGLITPQNG